MALQDRVHTAEVARMSACSHGAVPGSAAHDHSSCSSSSSGEGVDRRIRRVGPRHSLLLRSVRSMLLASVVLACWPLLTWRDTRAFVALPALAPASASTRRLASSRQAQKFGRRAPATLLRASATPAFVTIDRKRTELDGRVKEMEKPEDELYWRVLAFCTACRTPWCKLPWRKNTCLQGDAKAEGTKGNRCDMPLETYTDILVKSVPLLSRTKAQLLTRECWQDGDSDPSGIGTMTVTIVPKPAADEYCSNLGRNGIQCSVVPDSFFKGGPSSKQ